MSGVTSNLNLLPSKHKLKILPNKANKYQPSLLYFYYLGLIPNASIWYLFPFTLKKHQISFNRALFIFIFARQALQKKFWCVLICFVMRITCRMVSNVK